MHQLTTYNTVGSGNGSCNLINVSINCEYSDYKIVFYIYIYLIMMYKDIQK